MLEKKCIRILQILCLGTLAACQISPVSTDTLERETERETASVPVQMSASVESDGANTAGIEPEAANAATVPASAAALSTAYQDAINLASSAFKLGQQATSPDDWDLIVGRWEQAIQKLQDVPAGEQNYAVAQTKLKDYERNLAQAKQRLADLKQPPAEISLNRPTPIAKDSTVAVATAPSAAASGVARVPIIQRRGGTPVIAVNFNGRQYPMILDTGASHTHITRSMANDLGINVVGQASVATASNSRAVVDVGYVESIRVGNITHRNLPVSIGDAVPIGLLGNDVYKNFDVILQVNSVEFQPR
ncbi:putative aspartyl protease [Leptolyngbya sp. PCC 7375]|nr:putative aspartyl protease [Leptolyngbya sp. PCC 7375]